MKENPSGKVNVLGDMTIRENGERMLISTLGDLYKQDESGLVTGQYRQLRQRRIQPYRSCSRHVEGS